MSALRMAVDCAAANAAAWRERRARVIDLQRALHELDTTWYPMPADTDDYRASYTHMVDWRLQLLEDAIKGWGSPIHE